MIETRYIRAKSFCHDRVFSLQKTYNYQISHIEKTRDICIRSVWTGYDKMTYKEDNSPSMETWFGMVNLVFIQPYLSVVISDAFDFFAICKHH